MTSVTDLPCACATARQAARLLTQLYDSRLRPSGLEAPQFALLLTLEKLGACSQVDLCRRHALDKTTVSRNLKLLERKGWIAPSASNDRRERQFALTAEGRRCLEAALPRWKKAQQELRAVMTDEQWDAMFRVFGTIARAAQALQES